MKSKICGLLSVALLAGPMAANAAVMTYYVQGKFWDNGSLSGSFDIDTSFCAVSDPVSSISLATTTGAILFAASYSNYYSYDCSGGGFTGIAFGTSDSLLNLKFSQIVNGSGTFALTPSSTSDPTSGSFERDTGVGSINTRPLTSGSISTTPFGVPEPDTLALLGLGLAGLGLSRRRKAA